MSLKKAGSSFHGDRLFVSPFFGKMTGTVLLLSFCGVSLGLCDHCGERQRLDKSPPTWIPTFSLWLEECWNCCYSSTGTRRICRLKFQHFRCSWRNVGIVVTQERGRGGFAGLNSNIFAIAGEMLELMLLRRGDEVVLLARIPTFLPWMRKCWN